MYKREKDDEKYESHTGVYGGRGRDRRYTDYDEYDDLFDDGKDEKGDGKGRYGGWWGGWSGRDEKRSGSLSDWWGRASGGFSGFWKGDRKARLSSALQTVRRIGRIVHGRKLTFSWLETEAQVAQHSTARERIPVVQLDPTPLEATDLDGDWTEGRKVDALVGDALSRAAHHEYIEPVLGRESMEKVMGRTASDIAKRLDKPAFEKLLTEAGKSLYNAADYIYSERMVTDVFPGYSGYFGAERDFVHRPAQKQKLERAAADELLQDPRAFVAASLATIWDSLRPSERLDVGEKMDEEVSQIAQELREAAGTADAPSKLLGAAQAALNRLADYSIRDNPDCQDPDEGDESKMIDGANQMRMAGGRDEANDELDPSEANEIERLVSAEYQKETEEGLPSIGRQVGRREVDTFSIKAQASRNAYQDSLRRVRPLVARTRAALTFRNELRNMDEIGLRRGMVDEGSIHKLVEGEPRVFRRTEIEASPEIDIGLLADMSGSMGHGSASAGLTRADLARHCAILLVEACRGLRGVTTSVWGHTGDCPLASDGCLIYRFIEGGQGDVSTLGSIQAHSDNYDGVAIAYSANRLRQVGRQGTSKVLFVLADGYPAGHGYGGDPAMNHVAEVIAAARRQGVEVYCLGMGNGLHPDGLEKMYGKNGFVIVPDAGQLPRVLSGMLKKVLRTGRVA